MTKRQETEFRERKLLQNSGWNVNKASRYNSGSEMLLHSSYKQIAGHYLTHELGYRVNFEVMHEDTKESIDVLAWGVEDRISPLAVEIETNCDESIKDAKTALYVHNTPIQEVYFIDPLEGPENIMEAYAYIGGKL